MHARFTAPLALVLFAAIAIADVHETQTFAGPYGMFGIDNTRNTDLHVVFVGADNGAPYTPSGVNMVMDFTNVLEFNFGIDLAMLVTPPSGEAFSVRCSDEIFYDVLPNVAVSVRLPAAVDPVGTWTFRPYVLFESDGSIPDARVSNLRLSLEDLPPVEIPETTADLGVLGTANLTVDVPQYSGADVVWVALTLPQAAATATGFYVDLSTVGTQIGPGATELPNDTMLALFDTAGVVYAQNDNIVYGERMESWLTFGAAVSRSHEQSGAVYDGRSGPLPAGQYYAAAAAFYTQFDDGFVALMNSISPGGSLRLNVYSNFADAPSVCSPADLGIAGGSVGHDRVLSNNDFIAFITLFFNQDPAADLGVAGGNAGADGQWNNNDFIAFISSFFNDQADCTG